jgi:5-methylcytosine-specific restriction endonuclease McrA
MSVLPTSIELMSEIDALSVSDDQLAGCPAGPGPTTGSAGNAGPARPQDPDPEAVLVPLERLEERICELAAHLAAGTCRFLRLVAEFDARRGWACWDLPSCAAWLAWKCQVAPGTAREQVRVARVLAGLPVICAQFAAGRMSYAKVRALTRIATPQTEAALAEITGPMTAAQCERFAAAHRGASDADDVAARAARRVSVTVAQDGSVAISARLPAAEGAVVLQALRAAAGDCEHSHRPHHDTAEDTAPAENTVAAADSPAEDGGGVSAETPDGTPLGPGAGPPCRVAGHPAHPRRCHLDDGPAISPAAARALACRATVSWMLHDHDGTLLDVGRRHRRATAALRRAVRERDRGRCQFPGCRSRRTDIHHIIPWAKGGKTRLRDLILLCEAHHVIVHALGWLIAPAATGGFGFTRPDGQRMPTGPALPGSDGDLAGCHDADITTETIVPAGLGDKLDLDLAIWACFANARLDQQRAGQQHEQDLAA